MSLVSFGNRSRASGGAFYDYSARYGAVREEDKITLRQSMFPESIPDDFLLHPDVKRELPPLPMVEQKRFDDLAAQMGLTELLDLPRIALSNGQTRRARILKAILSKPELLLLDEPTSMLFNTNDIPHNLTAFLCSQKAGLDVHTRPALLSLLQTLHEARAPRVILGLRTQDPVPQWITHLAFVHGDTVTTGSKDSVLQSKQYKTLGEAALKKKRELSTCSVVNRAASISADGKVLVDLVDVSVKYGPRVVCPVATSLLLDPPVDRQCC